MELESGGVEASPNNECCSKASGHAGLRLAVVVFVSLAFSGCPPDQLVTVKEAVSTNIHQALPVATWLEAFTVDRPPNETAAFDLSPGYYRILVKSYCLHAGRYAPTRGDGYLIAPLLGERAEVIQHVLQRSAQHPEIPQQDVQRLLWGIEAGALFDDFDPIFQTRVAALLTPKEIVALSVNLNVLTDKLTALLPGSVQSELRLYTRLRSLATDIRASYESVEAVALSTGAAPLGPDSLNIGPGSWAYAGNGFYLRAFPDSYPHTTLEVIRPAPYALTRDDKGRVRTFHSGDFEVEISFDGSPEPVVVTAAERPSIAIWRLKSVRFLGPGQGQEVTLQDQGWILSSQPAGAGDPSLGASPPPETPSYEAVAQALAKAWTPDKTASALSGYRGQRNLKNQISAELLKDVQDLSQIALALSTLRQAEGPRSAREEIRLHSQRVSEAWVYATCAAAGDCDEGVPAAAAFVARFDPSDRVATPANTSEQRLGLSPRPECPGGCDDGIACTVDECVADQGCRHTPDNAACDDGVECTRDECNAGTGCYHQPLAIDWGFPAPWENPLKCPVNKLPSVLARAPAGGEDYQWSIEQGQAKVNTPAGLFGPDLELELRQASDNPNDVTIAVSYRYLEDGRADKCRAQFSVLQPASLQQLDNEIHAVFDPYKVETKRHYQVLSQLGARYPLKVANLEVSEVLHSVDVQGNPVTWTAGEPPPRLSFNPNLPEFLGEPDRWVTSAAMTAKTGKEGDFTDTIRIWDRSDVPLPPEMDFYIYQEIFVSGCRVGAYEFHYENDRVTITP